MKHISLTQDKVALVDDQDADLSEMPWHFTVGGYAVRSKYIKANHVSEMIYMHRIILERKLGRPLINGEITDHQNGNKLDNRRDNLRLSTKSQNAANSKRQTNNQAGYKGVHIAKILRFKKWRANIHVNGEDIFIGYFYSAEEAARAYDTAARKYFGEFAQVNFP